MPTGGRFRDSNNIQSIPNRTDTTQDQDPPVSGLTSIINQVPTQIQNNLEMSVQQDYYQQPMVMNSMNSVSPMNPMTFASSNPRPIPINTNNNFNSIIEPNSNVSGRINEWFHDNSTTHNNFPPAQIPPAGYMDGGPIHNQAPQLQHEAHPGFKEFQNDQLYGFQSQSLPQSQYQVQSQPELQQTHTHIQVPYHQHRNIHHQFNQIPPEQGQRLHHHMPHHYFQSDTESSPEIPKTTPFELGERAGSFNSNPNLLHYKPSVNFYNSPGIKNELESVYAPSPSISEHSFGYAPSTMSTFSHPAIPFRDHQSSTSSNSNTASSSKPSFSMSQGSVSTSSTLKHRHDSEGSMGSMEMNKSLKAKKPKKPINLRGGTCKVCSKVIKRDMTRHMRIHEEVSRFRCVYPRGSCIHKTGFFNRQYDFKKHLLHFHFEYDDPKVKKLYSLNEKLPHWGTCYCGLRFTGGDWLQTHILTKHKDKLCSHLARLKSKDKEEHGYHSDISTGSEGVTGSESS